MVFAGVTTFPPTAQNKKLMCPCWKVDDVETQLRVGQSIPTLVRKVLYPDKYCIFTQRNIFYTYLRREKHFWSVLLALKLKKYLWSPVTKFNFAHMRKHWTIIQQLLNRILEKEVLR